MYERVINMTGLPDNVIETATHEIASAFQVWRSTTQKSPLSMFSRGAFSQPSTRQEMLHAVATAATDGVVSGALDEIEALSIDGIIIESADQGTADLMNSVAADIDLDSVIRRMLREISMYGLFTAANWWATSTRTVTTTTTTGRPRGRTVRSTAPERVSILDITKVIPLSTGPWGTKRFLWQHGSELEPPDMADGNDRLFLGPYTPLLSEEERLTQAGATNTRALLELNPANVWHHTLTCPDYLLYPDPPLGTVLPLLELRARLLDSDRASLIGAANYLLVVKLGSDAMPTNRTEVQATREGMRNIAKLPIVVGDHRLTVDIVAPPTDAVLNPDKHSVIDMAIWCTMMGLPPRAAVEAMDPEILGNLMTSRLESRRKMVARGIEKHLLAEIVKRSPTARLETAKFSFRPRDIELYGLQTRLAAVLAARARRDLSRESYLGVLQFDQEIEAERMRREEELYDDVFKTMEPFSAAGQGGPGGSGSVSSDQGANGASGGRPPGAGDKIKRGRKTT